MVNVKDFFKNADFVDWLMIVCLIVGVVGRIVPIWTWDLGWDGSTYAYMGENFLQHGEFVDTLKVSFGETRSPYIFTDGYSHHYPPLYPMYLAAFYAIFGFSVEVTKVAAVVLSLILLVVVYFTTKDLYGKKKALIVTALSSVMFNYFSLTGYGFAENMVIIFFVLTIWAILRSLEDGKYIILAGVFAGLGYLTKSSVGYFFIIAGIGGLLWRFYYMKWDVFKDKHYLTAIVIFLSIVGIWALRNIMRFGSWETSAYVTFVTFHALSNPGPFVLELFIGVGVCLLSMLLFMVFWMPQLRKTISKIKNEHYSGLWLAVGLTLIIGIVFTAMFFLWERFSRIDGPVARYSLVAVTPLLWLIVKDVDFDKESRVVEVLRNIKVGLKKRARLIIFVLVLVFSMAVYVLLDWRGGGIVFFFSAFALLLKEPRQILAVMLSGFLIASVNAATQVRHNPYAPIGKDLVGKVSDGDTIALDLPNNTDFIFYDLYPATRGLSVEIVAWNSSSDASFIVSDKNISYPGYQKIGQYKWDTYIGVVNSIYYAINRFIRENVLSQQMERYDGWSLYLYEKTN